MSTSTQESLRPALFCAGSQARFAASSLPARGVFWQPAGSAEATSPGMPDKPYRKRKRRGARVRQGIQSTRGKKAAAAEERPWSRRAGRRQRARRPPPRERFQPKHLRPHRQSLKPASSLLFRLLARWLGWTGLVAEGTGCRPRCRRESHQGPACGAAPAWGRPRGSTPCGLRRPLNLQPAGRQATCH